LYPEGEEPPNELLRLREVRRWLGIPRDEIESWELNGFILPFRKFKSAKALYRKWQFMKAIGRQPKKQNFEPEDEFLRRGDVAAWLGVTAAEVDSWSRHGVIHADRTRRRGKALYRKSEIKKNVLGLSA
jgi:hypothetical protein